MTATIEFIQLFTASKKMFQKLISHFLLAKLPLFIQPSLRMKLNRYKC